MSIRESVIRQIIKEESRRMLREGMESDSGVAVEGCEFRNMDYELDPKPIVFVDVVTVGSYRGAKFELIDVYSIPVMVDRSVRGDAEVIGFDDPDHVDQLSFKIDGRDEEDEPDAEKKAMHKDVMYDVTGSDEVVDATRDCLSDAIDAADRKFRSIIEDELRDADQAARDPYGYRGVSKSDFYESRRRNRSADGTNDALDEARKKSGSVVKKGGKKASAGSVAIFKKAAAKKKGSAAKKKRTGFDAVKKSAEKWADDPAAVAQAATMVAAGEPVVSKGEKRKIKESNLIDALDAELQALSEGWHDRR